MMDSTPLKSCFTLRISSRWSIRSVRETSRSKHGAWETRSENICRISPVKLRLMLLLQELLIMKLVMSVCFIRSLPLCFTFDYLVLLPFD